VAVVMHCNLSRPSVALIVLRFNYEPYNAPASQISKLENEIVAIAMHCNLKLFEGRPTLCQSIWTLIMRPVMHQSTNSRISQSPMDGNPHFLSGTDFWRFVNIYQYFWPYF